MRKLLSLILILATIWVVGKYAYDRRGNYFSKYDGEKEWFNYQQSQYVQGEHSDYILSDSEFNAIKGYMTVIKGMKIIDFPAGHPPLATYLIGLSIKFFGNQNVLALVAGITSLVLVWLITWQIGGGTIVASLTTLLMASESLFLTQLNDALLDIYQLVLALSAIYFYFNWLKKEKRCGSLILSQLFLGLMLATKFFLGSLPLVGALLMATVFTGDFKRFVKHTITLLFVGLGFCVGHITYFFDNLSLIEFYKFQKYIISWWAGSSQVPPFGVWDLIFFNRWHTWWGEKAIVAASEWRITWPIVVIASILALPKAIKNNNLYLITLYLWLIPTLMFDSVSAVFPRHLLLILPGLYLLAVSPVIRYRKTYSDKE